MVQLVLNKNVCVLIKLISYLYLRTWRLKVVLLLPRMALVYFLCQWLCAQPIVENIL